MRKGIVGIIISLAMISVVFAQIPTDSLIAWYPFTGNANDSSGKGNNGTVIGATLTTDRFGNANSAYLFNGSGNMITLPILTKLNGSSHVTINAWVKATTGGSILAHWISTSANIGSPIGLIFGPSDKMAVYTAVNGGQDITTDTGLIIKNQWTMMTLIFDGSISNQANRLYAYINNQKIAFTSFSTAPTVPSSLGTIATFSEIGTSLNGTIDDIRIYNRVLSQNEVTSLYNEGLTNPINISINKTGFSGSPASFSVDSTFNSVVATFNTALFSTIDTLYICYEIANLTYLTQRTDKPVNYTVNVGGAVADFGNNISTGIFSSKAINITALKALSANFQVTFNYTGGGGEVIFANPNLLVYGRKVTTGGVQKAIIRPQSLMKAIAFPNPTRSLATINYSIPFYSSLDITLYDTEGKLIKNIFHGLKQPGFYNYVWDGTNLSGSSVANGKYFFRVHAASGQQISEQIVVLK